MRWLALCRQFSRFCYAFYRLNNSWRSNINDRVLWQLHWILMGVVYKSNIPSWSLLLLDGKKEFKLRGKLLFTVQPVREINSSDSAVGVDGHTQSFNVIASVSPPRKIRKIELDLIPALIEPHGHGADEGFDSGGGLIVGSPEAPSYVFIV